MRVLIAESDGARTQQIHELLATDPRFDVIVESADGDSAITRAGEVDAVVIDLRIHGRGSIGTIGSIRLMDNAPAILLIASPGQLISREAARREGVADVILWPTEAASLVQRLASLDPAGRSDSSPPA